MAGQTVTKTIGQQAGISGFFVVLGLIAFLAFPTPARSQLRTGSVLVVAYTKDEVAFAADSRGILLTTLTPNDHACKVLAIDGRILFGAVGSTLGLQESDSHPLFDASQEARQAVRHFDITPGATVEDIANQWGSQVKSRLSAIPANDIEYAAKYSGDGTGDGLISSVFAGVGNDGELSIVNAVIKYKGRSAYLQNVPDIGWTTQPNLPPASITIIFSGASDVILSIFTDRARGVEEQQRWAAYTGDHIPKIAVRLVDLTIAREKPSDFGSVSLSKVGGEVDAVVLKRSGQIQWIQRKANCPSN